MLTNYPPCPSCGEPDLYRVNGPELVLKCAECGFDSGWKTPRPDMDLNGNIATVVALAHVAAVKAAKGIE